MAKGIRKWFEFGRKNLILIYILFLCGALFPPFIFIGVILAYVNKDDALDSIYHSHYVFIIRNFWLLLLIGLISFILTFSVVYLLGHKSGIFIGLLIITSFSLIIIQTWYIIRIIAGMNILIKDRQHPNPKTWGFIK